MSAPLRYISGKPKPAPFQRPHSIPTASTSRAPPQRGPPQPTGDEDRRVGEYWSIDDVCPVCKSDRYLTPDLRLLVSFCYHKMCESCMDRIFSLGPEPCPICHVRIRKNQFKPQLFESLGVQKEINVRKRTAKIFNQREEDFPDLQSYNDYLETYEDLTFNLINNEDVEATELKIKQYEQENRARIEENLSRTDKEASQVKLREAEDKRAAEEQKLIYERLDEEERLAKEEERAAVLQSLASSTVSTETILSAARTSALKRSTAREAETLALTTSAARLASFRLLAGLAGDSPLEADEPEDVLKELGMYDSYEDFYDVRGRSMGYRGEDGGVKDEGGLVVEEVWEKAVRSAVAGLFLPPVGFERKAKVELEDEDVEMVSV